MLNGQNFTPAFMTSAAGKLNLPTKQEKFHYAKKAKKIPDWHAHF